MSAPPLTDAMAEALALLECDPDLDPVYEGFSDSLIWLDEINSEFEEACRPILPEAGSVIRSLWAYRASVVRGSADSRFERLWAEMESNYPNWPGLLPDRRSTRWRAHLEIQAEEFLRACDEGSELF